MLRNILRLTVPALIVLFLVLELIFTFLIRGSEFPYYHYDQNDRILRFSTTEQRTGVFTIGAMAQQRANWRINNAGWNSAIDFVEAKRRPRIAIIGDSYVEAFQVDVEDSIAGQLRHLVDPKFEVYAFGISGASLSQYLQMARYVRTHFDPDILVINVVHNDFEESLCSVKRQTGMLCLEDSELPIREAPIVPYESNSVLRLARHSSVIRFAHANLQITARWQRLMSGLQNAPEYNANIDVERTRSHRSRIEATTEYVLATLKRENAGKPIVFQIDAPRKDIYAHALQNSNVSWLNELLREHATRFGFVFLDLTDEFTKIVEIERVHLESEYDWHWNQRGHRAAAYALHQALQKSHLLE